MKQKIGNILFIASILLFVAGGFLLSQKIQGDKEADKVYEEVRDAVSEGDDPDGFAVDWEALEGTDVVAWIRVGSRISYPVLQGKDNAVYLHHLYNGKYNYAGSIFLHAACAADFTGDNSIVYGHNMRNGSMFGTLKRYLKKPEDPYFYIYLPDGTRHTYQIASVANVKDGTKAYTYQFADTGEFVEYQKYMISKSVWNTGAKAEENVKLVSLSTCSSIGSKRGHRIMIQGMEREVRQVQEPASWYSPQDEPENTEMEGDI